MRINRVTMTGADDSIDPVQLAHFSHEFPFVEWGILRSRTQNGERRFPSKQWVEKLKQIVDINPIIQLSAHLCGAYVREIVEQGDLKWMSELDENPTMYNRVQLNFHAENHTFHEDFDSELKEFSTYNFIFQMDGTDDNEKLYYGLKKTNKNIFPLFDISGGIGGIGVSPKEWPKQFKNAYCGYAGGLGPDNLEKELERISKVVDDTSPIWIDMETKIRSNNDMQFDMEKVLKCLEIVKPFIVD